MAVSPSLRVGHRWDDRRTPPVPGLSAGTSAFFSSSDLLAANLGAEVITGDRKDLRRLVTASGKRIRLHDV
jgi:hypothetical protein